MRQKNISLDRPENLCQLIGLEKRKRKKVGSKKNKNENIPTRLSKFIRFCKKANGTSPWCNGLCNGLRNRS